MSASDTALYEAKTGGRGRTAVAPARHDLEVAVPG